jgi:hypothetical protein
MLRILLSSLVVALACLETAADEAIDVGSRLELFVDDFLIDQVSGAGLVLHQPVSREVAITHDEPWEGNICCGHVVFQDGDLYRMYYRGRHYDEETKRETHWFSCYAESVDGIHWTKPKLGLVEFRGSNQNNIILQGQTKFNLAPFKDTSPGCKPDERYKAMTNGRGGMDAYKSPDGIRWAPMVEGHVITEGAFDSLNLAFWDPLRDCYSTSREKADSDSLQVPRKLLILARVPPAAKSRSSSRWGSPSSSRYARENRLVRFQALTFSKVTSVSTQPQWNWIASPSS